MILENVSNFWPVNLKAYDNYNPRTSPSVFSPTTKIDSSNNGNNGPESTPKPNISTCNEFIATTIRKKSVYIAAAKNNE